KPEAAKLTLPTRPRKRLGVQFYEDILFHGPDLHGIESIDDCTRLGVSGEVVVAPPSSAWIHNPLRGSWLADPLVLDSAFQMMIVWCYEQLGACSLPCFIGGYRQYR